MKISENIKKMRIERGWSQLELAKKVGYNDRSTIAKIESGDRDLNQTKIKAFADAFGVSPSELIGWEYYEVVSPTTSLSDNERQLIALFRDITEDQQKLVLNMVKAACGK